ncbi:MAG TPA: MFS transporter [Burkholderiales bacterium]|nr:MFS transporter [Burkholderiales bacterium]
MPLPGAPSVYFVVLLSVLSNIGLRGSRVLVSLSALHLGANSFMVGVLAALFSVFPLVLAVYAGRVSDRVGVRAPIVLGSAGMAAALLLPALHEDLLTLLACPALIGLGQIFVQVSIQNAVGSIGGAEQRAGNFGTFSLGASISTFVGPSLAGFSIDALGFRPSYVVLASMSLAVVLLALLFGRRMPDRGAHESEQKPGRTLDLFREGPLRRTLFMSGAALTGIELFSFYMPIYGKSIGLSASGIGLVLSAYAGAAFVVRLAMQELARRYSETGVLTASLFIAAGTYALFPLLSGVAMLVLVAFLLGLGLGSAQPLTIMLTYHHAPEGRSGEALGMRLTVNKITQIAIPVVFGGIGALFGLAPVFWANAAFLLASGVMSAKDRRAVSSARPPVRPPPSA